MNKRILLLFALILAFIGLNGQQCQNLSVQNTEATCAIPSTTLSADFLNLGYQTTDSYALNGEAMCPPEHANPSTANIAPDDAWAPVIFNLGFTFCFYGNMYDQVIVSGNGVISFDLSIVEDYIDTGSSLFHYWNTDASLDLPSPQLQPNAIFGPYTDPDPSASPNPFETIKFDILHNDNPGNRVFVIEYDVPMFHCNSEFLHSRIKLYETSNVIDIEILEKGRCDDWENSIGIVGIQNKSATLATIVPGRTNADGGWWVNGDPNYGGNEAEQELWRFIPDGNPLNYSFKWWADYGNGYEELFPGQDIDESTIEVNPTMETDYKAELIYYSECQGVISLEEAVSVTPPALPNVQNPENLYICETTLNGGSAIFNLDQQDLLMAQYDTADWSDFNIFYYTTPPTTANDYNASSTPIATLNPYTATDGTIIYIRVEDVTDPDCDDFGKQFALNVLELEDFYFEYNTPFCTSTLTASPQLPTYNNPSNIIQLYEINNGGVWMNPSTTNPLQSNDGIIDIIQSYLGTDGSGNFNITHTISSTYENTTETCPQTITKQIHIAKDSSFDYPDVACKDDSTAPVAINFTSDVNFTISTGGIFSNASNGEIDLGLTPTGTYTITYERELGCPITHEITIYDSKFNYPNDDVIFCFEGVNPISEISIGEYTINNGGIINVATGEIDIQNSYLGNDGTGLFEVTHTINGECSYSLNIEIIKDTSFDFPTETCSNDNNPETSNIAENGGTYTVSNGATIDSNGTLDLSTTTEGETYTIEYAFTSGSLRCFTAHDIFINFKPDATMPITVLMECNNGDDTANFDVLSLENEIIGSQTGMILTFHLTEQDANDNTNAVITSPHARVSGNIWARVESMEGCYNVVEIPLIVEDCYAILPQAFSPNSNVVENQTFNVRNLRENYPDFKLYIYNRFGNLVYEGDTTTDNWNGKLENEGDLLPTGTYFYGLKLNDEQELQYRGWIYLQE